MAIADAEDLICALLRQARAHWNAGDDAGAITTFLETGRSHGVLPLLDREFRRRKETEAWPAQILAACCEAARLQAMFELAHRVEMARVVEALTSAGVSALLLKGSALAYSHYPSAALRPRADTDLLIPRDRRKQTEFALNRLGYARSVGVEGEFISYQATWRRADALGATHYLDIHWRINNSQILAKALAYEELALGATPLPALQYKVRALAPVHALLLACLHRAGHAVTPYYTDGVAKHGGDRLIWLYDIHLLVARMSVEDLDKFAALAASKKVKAICGEGLQRTQECFATPIPRRLIDVLNGPGPSEASALYLSGNRARQMVGDFLALDRWSDRGGWLKELVFPSASYMRSKYADAAIGWLPALYARRALTGVKRALFSRKTSHGE